VAFHGAALRLQRAWHAVLNFVRHPVQGMTAAIKHPLIGPMIICTVFLSVIGGIVTLVEHSARSDSTDQVANGEYVAPRNVIRVLWEEDPPPQDAPTGVTRGTTGACDSHTTLTLQAFHFTVGGEFSVRIRGYYLDSGWVDTVDEFGNAEVPLNCFIFPQGGYNLTMVDLTTQKIIRFTFVSERLKA
jgi:hypothetical protein